MIRNLQLKLSMLEKRLKFCDKPADKELIEQEIIETEEEIRELLDRRDRLTDLLRSV